MTIGAMARAVAVVEVRAHLLLERASRRVPRFTSPAHRAHRPHAHGRRMCYPLCASTAHTTSFVLTISMRAVLARAPQNREGVARATANAVARGATESPAAAARAGVARATRIARMLALARPRQIDPNGAASGASGLRGPVAAANRGLRVARIVSPHRRPM